MDKRELFDQIQHEIGYPASLENLAEECAELSHAALKLARILRKENPTPDIAKKVEDELNKEAIDVILCINICEIPLDLDLYDAKINRTLSRIKEMKDIKETREVEVPSKLLDMYEQAKKAMEEYAKNAESTE